MHYQLKSPFSNFFLSQSLVSLWIRLHQVLLEKEKYHPQKFYILMLFNQADHLSKLKTKEALIPILVELQNFFSLQSEI